MTSTASIAPLLITLVRWAANQPHILAVAMVGSYARGKARPDSDIDLIILTSAPEAFREDTQWMQEIGWEHVQAHMTRWRDVEYGQLWSRHIQLSTGLEVEFGFAPPQWAAIDPLDEGTQEVVQDGFWILLDPTGLLNQLLQQMVQLSK